MTASTVIDIMRRRQTVSRQVHTLEITSSILVSALPKEKLMVKLNIALNLSVFVMLGFFVILVQKNIEKYEKLEADLQKIVTLCK